MAVFAGRLVKGGAQRGVAKDAALQRDDGAEQVAQGARQGGRAGGGHRVGDAPAAAVDGLPEAALGGEAGGGRRRRRAPGRGGVGPGEEQLGAGAAVRVVGAVLGDDDGGAGAGGGGGEAPDAEAVRAGARHGPAGGVELVLVLHVLRLRVRVDDALHGGEARHHAGRLGAHVLGPLRQPRRRPGLGLGLGLVCVEPVARRGRGREAHQRVARRGRLVARVGPVDDEACRRFR